MAAAFSAVSGLEEVPKYFGRRNIDQAFEIDGKLANPDSSNESTLEEHLIKHNFRVPKEYLKSGCFEYLVPKMETGATSDAFIATEAIKRMKSTKFGLVNSITNDDNTKTSITARVTQGHAAVGTVLGQFGDDAARFLIPATNVTGKTLSTVCATAGFVFIPVFAAWSFYSAKRHLNNYLDMLRNDLVFVFASFINAVCSDCIQKTKWLELCTDCFSEVE
ncbi:unnamed protein product [Rotaria magnacalcarata]|uniref:Uncharacterized protein n=2 Tax=Rotaria magnacalcarata TaxID=392030 RepID=A0A818ZNU3_9BILA|nr:unnamed protein product [Rotaria magnacalcarata]CAF2046198.1 unnamed protein product [Rotaria magnacalcarata]CAF2051938.1 unnamed protein product [Rotaria magnacalcarata]CAF3771563.1 unnamed protein product [Rotaria magnacalcarata]CAF4269633.1 unnamed protein product [Rotaria magnacalcarata]